MIYVLSDAQHRFISAFKFPEPAIAEALRLAGAHDDIEGAPRCFMDAPAGAESADDYAVSEAEAAEMRPCDEVRIRHYVEESTISNRRIGAIRIRVLCAWVNDSIG